MRIRLNKKRCAAVFALAAVAAMGGFAAGRALGADEPASVKLVLDKPYVAMVDLGKVSLGEFVISAYCPCEKCCGVFADGLTASGTVATEGRTCAVDPEVIPLGSVLDIGGVEYVAEDVGGAIKGRKIDICFNDHRSAVEYGVRLVEVYAK